MTTPEIPSFQPAQAAQFADGDNPCVLEWGAVSLPMGDPSRITELKLCPTLWAAIAEGALCGFDWRVYPMADVVSRAENQAPEGADLRTTAQRLLTVLDAQLFTNDHCGLQTTKQAAPMVDAAVEALRAALAAQPQPATFGLNMTIMPAVDQDERNRMAAALLERAGQPQPSGPAETMTLQEVWDAMGGNPGISPSRADVLLQLKLLDQICDDADSARPAPAEGDALRIARDALEEIALAGMSGTGQESEEGMRAWHARQAWKFIGIAARAVEALKTAAASDVQPKGTEPLHLGACLTDGKLCVTVMRREANDCITVVATAEIAESMLRKHDCHAVMAPAVPCAAVPHGKEQP